MADVEIAVGLGWKAGMNPTTVGTGRVVLVDGVLDEVRGRGGFGAAMVEMLRRENAILQGSASWAAFACG